MTEKSMQTKVRFMHLIRWTHNESALGDIRVINIVRDGRDVALSWCKEWFGPPNMKTAAKLWGEYVTFADNYAKKHPEKVYTIYFEDLIKDTEQTLAKIAKFAGLTKLEKQQDNYAAAFSNAISQGGYHVKVGQASDISSVRKWQTEMCQEDQAIFADVASDILQRHGYPGSGVPQNVRNNFWRPNISFVSLLRFARNTLPLFLAIGSWILPFRRDGK